MSPRERLGRTGWKIRRFFANLAYRLRIVKTPRTTGRFNTWVLVFLVSLCCAVFFLSGGIYDLLEKPVSLLPRSSQQGWTFIYPGGIGAQTLNESILTAMLYPLGTVGLYLLFRSTRFAYRPRNAYILLILGFLLTIVIIYYSTQLLAQKTG